MYNLGYDIGSSTVKIALVDAKTNHEIDVLTHPKEEMPIYAAQSGWAEQDPELWWIHLCEGTKKILFENKIQSKEILAIGIGHDVSRYYNKAIKITDVNELGDVMISQLSGLFEKKKLH